MKNILSNILGKSQHSDAEDAKESQQQIIETLLENMVLVDGGTFIMGATAEQSGEAVDREGPAHLVTLSSFYIGKFPVTQKEWLAIMGENPSNTKNMKHPVEQVSWDDCQEFIHRLNDLSGLKFRLPTEAEWEYASRGGNKSLHYMFAGGNNLYDVGWNRDNSGGSSHPVGEKKPNELGLYDMAGNVWEWCQDWSNLYTGGMQTNPTGPTEGNYKINRGGSWLCNRNGCRVSFRRSRPASNRSYTIGIRLVREVEQE